MSKYDAEKLEAAWEGWFRKDQLLVDDVAEKNAQLEAACKEREKHQHERPSLVRIRELGERFRKMNREIE